MKKIIVQEAPTIEMVNHYYPVERIANYLLAVIKSKYNFDSTRSYYIVFYFNTTNALQIKVVNGLNFIEISDSELLYKRINWSIDIQKKYREGAIIDLEELKYNLGE